MNQLLFTVFAVGVICCYSATGAQAAPHTPSALSTPSTVSGFEKANLIFERANAKALVNPAEAQDLYQAAILKYKYLADHAGIDSPQLFANLGNAYFFSGDHGRAVLSYQRALRLSPHQDDVRHNLRYVRGLTVDELPATRTQKMGRVLSFWHRWPFAVRTSLFTLAHISI